MQVFRAWFRSDQPRVPCFGHLFSLPCGRHGQAQGSHPNPQVTPIPPLSSGILRCRVSGIMGGCRSDTALRVFVGTLGAWVPAPGEPSTVDRSAALAAIRDSERPPSGTQTRKGARRIDASLSNSSVSLATNAELAGSFFSARRRHTLCGLRPRLLCAESDAWCAARWCGLGC